MYLREHVKRRVRHSDTQVAIVALGALGDVAQVITETSTSQGVLKPTPSKNKPPSPPRSNAAVTTASQLATRTDQRVGDRNFTIAA